MSSQVRLEGMLEKLGTGVLRNKTKVWMTLDDNSLAYYRAERRSSCIGSVDVSEITSVDLSGGSIEFEVKTNNKSVKFAAGSSESAINWVESIRQVISRATETGEVIDNSVEKRGSSQYQKEVETLPALAAGTSIFGVKLNPRRSRQQSSKSLSKPDNEAFDGHCQADENIKQAVNSDNMGMHKSKLRRKVSGKASSPVSPSTSCINPTENTLEQRVDNADSTKLISEAKDDPEANSSKAEYENDFFTQSGMPDKTRVTSGDLNDEFGKPTPSHLSKVYEEVTDQMSCRPSGDEEVSSVVLRKSKLNSSSEASITGEVDNNKGCSEDKHTQDEQEISTSPVMMRKSRSSRSSMSSRSNASITSIDTRIQNKVSVPGKMDPQDQDEKVPLESKSVLSPSNPSLQTVSESDTSESDNDANDDFEKNDALINLFAVTPKDKTPVSDISANGLYLSNVAFLKLKQLFEQDNEKFELSKHQVVNPDAVKCLKDLIVTT